MASVSDYLNRPLRVELWFIRVLTKCEKCCHRLIRHASFPHRMFAISLLPTSALAALMILTYTGTTTVVEASEVCKLRFHMGAAPNLTIDQQEFWKSNFSAEIIHTLPANLVTMLMALVGLQSWLFFSPHQKNQNISAKCASLDRKLGSFFGIQYIASVLTIVLGNVSICTESKKVHLMTIFLYTLVILGLNLIGTNLLCHRYLLERAAIMIKISKSVSTTKHAWFSLKSLNSSFIWEIRALIASGIVMAIFVFDSRVALAAGAMIAIFIFASDTIFSVIVTYMFLKPMLDVLRPAGEKATTGIASKRLERTMRWNLAGVFFAVGSSTILYINVIVFFLFTFCRWYSMNSNRYANPFAFGFCVDAIANILGMVLLCGMFKDVHLVYHRSTSRATKEEVPRFTSGAGKEGN